VGLSLNTSRHGEAEVAILEVNTASQSECDTVMALCEKQVRQRHG
jgi:hypothetical protein